MHKIKKLLLKLENSWIFWAIFIFGFFTICTMILTGGVVSWKGFMLIPLGLLFFFGDFGERIINWWVPYLLIYYSIVGFIVYKIVKDKKFNIKLVLLLLIILISSFVGCALQLGGI